MTGIANAVNGPEAAPYLAKAGGTMTGALTLNSSSPASNLIAASKGYVDSVAQGRIFKDPVVAATTATFSATYANGASGVGATLTGTVMAAFAPDGVTLALNDRVLFKDQASSFQSGIYTTTTLGTGAVLPVFTRATDMDLAAEFKGATTFIIGGTVNAGRTYTETATVVTIGTDAVTFALTGDSTGLQQVVSQTISATGTYTPTTGMTHCIVQIVGGGGGGGGAGDSSVANGTAASGGGGGGYCYNLYTAAQIGANAAVVIGAAGTGGVGAANGVAGGNSTFTPAGGGATLTANGGALGSTNAIGTAVITSNSGAGGTASGGQININGSTGTPAILLAVAADNQLISGSGGNSQLGSGNRGVPPSQNGLAGGGFGSGGSGAAGRATASTFTGGAGTIGICYITEFIA